MVNEVWKPVVGYEGRYEVSNLGKVRSLGVFVRRWEGRSWHEGRILTQSNKPVSDNVYKTVMLYNDQTHKRFYVHSLVLIAFVGPRPKGMDCCHFPDRNGSNNNLLNLRWDTRKGNLSDMEHHKTIARGENHPSHKLTNQQVKEIRAKYLLGETPATLAKDFKVSKSNVYYIIRNLSRKLG